RARKATMQTVVSHAAIAVAKARLLIDQFRNLRRQFVRVPLIRVLCARSPELVGPKDRLELLAFGRRARVEMGQPLIVRLQPWRGNQCHEQEKTYQPQGTTRHRQNLEQTFYLKGRDWQNVGRTLLSGSVGSNGTFGGIGQEYLPHSPQFLEEQTDRL